MSADWKGPSHFHLTPYTRIISPTVSPHHRQLTIQCCMKPQTLFRFFLLQSQLFQASGESLKLHASCWQH